MSIKIISTNDGSKSLFLPEMNETYHSKFGAITESKHVFIQSGYQYIKKDKINILEIGFGTGLNVFLTYLQQLKDGKNIYFETIEKYPLSFDIIEQINTFEQIDEKVLFNRLHQITWNEPTIVADNFVLHKVKKDLLNYETNRKFDLVYFDAFAPDKQKEMWTKEVFEKMYNLLHVEGVLVTYSAKGSVRRIMERVGLQVMRLPGPPGKREMLRAIKL